MTEVAAGPASDSGRRANGVPPAIALSPILSARYRRRDLDAIAAASPGSRLVSVSLEGLADSDLNDVEVLLRGPLPTLVFDRLLARCPRLRWVHSATAGVERVLTPAAIERGLLITNARGVFSEPIAEYVLMMILAISRRLPQLLELQKERTWQPLEANELADVTIGVVGLGSIGQRVAELASAFGAHVVGVRREVDAGRAALREGSAAAMEVLPTDRLPELLGRSDYIVLALPLTADTDEMFDAELLGQVKPGAWLINVARGRLVDERALVRALREGPLGGAVLDTFVEEPLPSSSVFYGLSNVIVTPHTSWSSGRALDRSIDLFCENLRRYAAGEEMLNLVDPAVGY
jgi:phosphoglycerate dehydrogenase-like enzyme